MTQGVIIFLVGGGESPEMVKAGTHYQGLRQPNGPLEVVVSQPGILELDDAWHFLLSRGCDPIHLLVTRTEQDRLHPLYPLVRLTDISRVVVDASGFNRPGGTLH